MLSMPEAGRIHEEKVAEHRASVIGMEYADTSSSNKQIYRNILPINELYSLRVVPIAADEHHIRFGITTTTAQQTVNKLIDRFSDYRTSFAVISDSGFREYMMLYDPPKKVVYDDIAFSGTGVPELVQNISKMLSSIRPDDMLAYLVQQAHQLKASDIHLECQRDGVQIRFRVDGVLHLVAKIAYENYRHLLSVLASAANVSTEVREAQTGHISRQFKLATGEDVTLNLRVETVKTVYGMDVVMRLFNLKLEFFHLQNLGLSEDEADVVGDIIKHPTGLVMIVGPTGSGKTTTLYSLINTLNTTERKIITLEDPVEYNIPGIIQIPVEGDMNKQSFAERLRAVLRLDPDVVMVGEIRDQDTAKTALQGALTGHLVLSTFHASSAAAALTRLVDMIGVNPLFTSAIRLIMAQRLVRRLDDSTKIPYQPDSQLKIQLQKVIDSFPPDVARPNLDSITLYKAGKSEQNPFGYQGQLALREQLTITSGVSEILKLSSNQITTEALQDVAVKDGMRTMLQDGILKAVAGLTSIEEVYRVVDY